MHVLTGLHRSLQALQVQNVVEKSITPKQNIHTVFPFTISGTPMYAVLVCEKQHQDPLDDDDSARLSVYKVKQSEKVSVVWRSGVIPCIQHRGYYSADLWACRMTGGDNPELVFMGVCHGGSANPTLTYIFRWNGRTFRKVLEAVSGEQPMWINKLGKSGRRQVRCVELVGDHMCHAEQVRWPTIYDWNGTCFVESDSQYPGPFRDTLDQLEELHRTYQDDWEVTRYLAKANMIEGRTREARRLFRKVAKANWRKIASDSENSDAWSSLGEIAEWGGRKEDARVYYRKAALSLRTMIKHCRNEDDLGWYVYRMRIVKYKIRELGRNPI